ncbi:hypothetical protein HK099_004994 [Clydaea vesicula]|uniref:Uncharacterized protein n=1 Tax=Clydaea vesicula TaxID=447962 RepID=A0AAD5XZ89_9FUNG|nr:hypothetical protein HK099_004994 [Clydaea vesicula]
MLSEKNLSPDWNFLLQKEVQNVIENKSEIESQIESIYPTLVSIKIDLSDKNATKENILGLFKLAQLGMELKNIYLEQAESQIRTVEATLEAQEDELKKLRILSMGPQSALVSAEMKSLEETIQDLELRNESLTQDLSEKEETLENEKKKTSTLTDHLKEESAKVTKLEETLGKLKRELSDARLKVFAKKDTVNETLDDIHFKNTIKEKNAQISNYITEVQNLSTRNAYLASENEAMTQEIEAAVFELDKYANEKVSNQKILLKNDQLIDHLTEEKNSLKYQLNELAEQIQSRGGKDEGLLEELQSEVIRHKKSARESYSGLLEKTSENEILHEKVKLLKEELDSLGIDTIKKDLSERDEIISVLKEKLEGAYQDIELLSTDWDNLETLLNSQKNEANMETIKTNFAQVQKLKEKMQAYKLRRKEDLKKASTFNEQLEEKEKELIDLRLQIEKYENGVYGLPDAIREIKNLKLKMNLRNNEISELTLKINDFELQANEFIEENSELRNKLGISKKTKIDLTNLKSNTILELEKAKALNVCLQKEVDDLEEERLKLKSELRFQSREKGENAIAMGLTVDDLIAVEDYANKLRMGADTSNDSLDEKTRGLKIKKKNGDGTEEKSRGLGNISRPNLSNNQLDKFLLELERTHVEGEEYREAISTLQTDLEKYKDENRALESVIREISLTLIKTRSTAPEQKGQPQSEVAFPIVQKLMKILENKEKRIRAMDMGKDASEDILEMNIQLREELSDVRALLDQSSHSLYLKNCEFEKLQADFSKLKEKSDLPRKRLLNLPADLVLGTVHDYSALVEQLIECLSDSQTKDKEILETKKSLEQYHEKYSILMGRQKLLYKDYHEQETKHIEQTKTMQDMTNEAEHQKEIAQMKAKELEHMVENLKAGPEEISRNYIVVHRNFIALKANEAVLIRRHKALTEVESHLRKHNSSLQADVLALDKSAKETIMRLIVKKKELEVKVEVLLRKLDESVPATLLAQADHKLEAYIAKTRLLLEREQEWICQKSHCEIEIKKARETNEENEKLQLQYFKAQETAVKMEDALGALSNQFSSGGPISRNQVVEAYQKIAKLEVELQVLKKRSELAEFKCEMLGKVEIETKDRLATVDRLYIESMEENMRLRDTEMNLKNSYEGGADKEQNEKNLKEIEQLKTNLDTLQHETLKCKYSLKRKEKLTYSKQIDKHLSEISTQQASDLIRLHAIDEKEKEILNAAIIELQMDGEERLLIGKMHQHIIALQVSESQALRKMEILAAKCLQLETNVVQLEKVIDIKDNHIYQMHLDSKSRVRILQGVVSDLRARMSGVVLLSKHERTCNLVQQLNSSKIEMDVEMRKTMAEKRNIEDKLVVALEKVQTQEQLISTLRDNTPGQAMILNWHKKMSENQLSELKLQREVMHMKQSETMAVKELEDSNKRTAQLELELVELQSFYDGDKINWEQREFELELKIQGYEEEREKIFQAATVRELKEALPDRTLPIYQQLEVALRLLVERTRLLATQDIKIAELENKLKINKEELDDLESEKFKKDYELNDIKQNMTQYSVDSNKFKEIKEEEFRNKIREREEHAMKTAQTMIASLRRQLAQKNDMVDKYQNMMLEMRDRMGKINEEEEVKKFREQVLQLEEKLEFEKKTSLQKIESLNNDLITKLSEIEHQEEQIAELEEQVKDLKAMTDESVYKEMEDMIVNLKKQIFKRDKEHIKHTKAISELKKCLLQFSVKEESLNMKLNEEAEALDDDMIKKYEAKIDKLKIGVDRYRNDVSSLEHKNRQLIEENQGLMESLSKKKKDVNQILVDLNRLQKNLREKDKKVIELGLKMTKINEENENLHKKYSVLENKYKVSEKSFSQSKVQIQSKTLQSSKATSLSQKTIESIKKPIMKSVMIQTIANLNEKNSSNNEVQGFKTKIKTLEDSLTIKTVEVEKCNQEIKLLKYNSSKEKEIAQNANNIEVLGKNKNDDFSELCFLKSSGEELTVEKFNEQKNRLKALELEVENWRKIAEFDKPNEIRKIQKKCKQLHEKNQELEELNKNLHKNHYFDELNKGASRGERSMQLSMVLESRIKDLMEKNHSLENSFDDLKNEISSARFEVDAAVASEKRKDIEIKEIIKEMEELKIATKKKLEEGPAVLMPGLTISTPWSELDKALTPRAKNSTEDLIKVIEHLSKTNDSLKSDIEYLKKQNPSNVKYMDLLKEYKKQKLIIEENKKCSEEKNETSLQLAKIEQENGKLRKQVKKFSDGQLKLIKEEKKIEIENDTLKKEITTLRATLSELGYSLGDEEIELNTRMNTTANSLNHSTCCKEINELKADVQEKDDIIRKLMNPENSNTEKLIAEVRKLTKEVDLWKLRVNNLNNKIKDQESKIINNDDNTEFLIKKSLREIQNKNALLSEELEDLKYNYRVALKSNIELEDKLKGVQTRTGSSKNLKDEIEYKPLQYVGEDIKVNELESNLRTDLPDFILLCVLYLLQGVPLGLALGSIPFILKSKLSFSDLALFSLSSYPYSLKLLVNSIYFKSFGRRKSWIVPIQAVTGLTLFLMGGKIENLLESETIPVKSLVLAFTSLVFLCATQDIAVDGWALTLLSDKNKAYASTAQTIGLTTGYFLSFTVFLALNSAEFWLVLFKTEKREVDGGPEEILEVYNTIWKVCKTPHMKQFIVILMIAKIGFIANENVTGLKLLEYGFKKEDLALAVLLDFPCQLLFGYYAARWSAGPKPLRPWLYAFHGRLILALLGMLVVYSFPSDGIVTTNYFLVVIVSTVLSSFMSTVQFVGMGSFFTKISDPVIGGTYMTLLNTLKAVDLFTISRCSKQGENGLFNTCSSESSKISCKSLGGDCETEQDGYYYVALGCFLLGFLSLTFIIRPTIGYIENLNERACSLPARDRGDSGNHGHSCHWYEHHGKDDSHCNGDSNSNSETTVDPVAITVDPVATTVDPNLTTSDPVATTVDAVATTSDPVATTIDLSDLAGVFATAEPDKNTPTATNNQNTATATNTSL